MKHKNCGGEIATYGKTEIDGEQVDVYQCDKCGISTVKPEFEEEKPSE